nr:hypothetical protein [Streptomyces albicerus]
MDQQLLSKTFVQLADNLVADLDLMDFLCLPTDRCVGMLGVSAAGRTTKDPAWSASAPAHRSPPPT